MSTTYTGNGASFTPGTTFSITEPADGDAANAASVNTALSKVADAVEAFRSLLHMGTTAPSIVNGTGAGSGTGITISLTGTDRGGLITVHTGSISPSGSSVCTVTFASTWTSTPSVVICPANNAAAVLVDASQVCVTPISTTAFQIQTLGGVLSIGTTYAWNYVASV